MVASALFRPDMSCFADLFFTDDRARIDAVVNMGLHQKYLSPVVGKKYSLQDVSTAHTVSCSVSSHVGNLEKDIIAHSHHGKMVLQC